VATGIAWGTFGAFGLPAPALSPLAALEQSILSALSKPPCGVSFSGGRDSSAVLALAADIARREGLPLPVPVTNRFREAPRSEETEWQERVIDHVRPADWVKLEFTDELDVVGPVATDALRNHGLLWPCNVHFHVPLFEAVRGGSLLTGIGGDEIFGTSRWERANLVLSRRVRPRPRDVLAVALALAPPLVRRLPLRRRTEVPFTWLTDAGREGFARAVGAFEASEPRHYRRRLAWWHGLRMTRISLHSLDLLAADAATAVVSPFADPAFASSVVDAAPRTGPTDRGAFMKQVLGDVLPDSVYERRSKATFDEAFWRAPSRELAAAWNGEGADPELVDPEALRREWAQDVPEGHTFTLLQAAWLSRAQAPPPASRAGVPSPRATTPTPPADAAHTPAATRGEEAAPAQEG
jgi:asparagine synthase (glutamine-hydrolysing)